MNIVVVMKQVPNLADELEIAESGDELDGDYVNWVVNEYDDHALEEALLLKEQTGGSITVLGLGTDTIDDLLYKALAKGADGALKVGEFEGHVDSHTAARAFAAALKGISYDLVLVGVQAIDDIDGQVGPLIAMGLGHPHVSVVTHIAVAGEGDAVTVNQEYAGGVFAEFELSLPAVLGVQAAREIPRYAALSLVRQLKKSTPLETIPVDVESDAGVAVRRLFKPEAAGRAEMLDGDTDAVVERVMAILDERGLLRN